MQLEGNKSTIEGNNKTIQPLKSYSWVKNCVKGVERPSKNLAVRKSVSGENLAMVTRLIINSHDLRENH